MKIIALYSIKGGVGKTAASVNLAYLAARDGAPTLVCDLDPQGSASYYFRIKPSKKFNSKVLIKGGKKIDKNIKGTDYEYLDLLPSDFSYRNLDIRLDNLKRSRKRLKEILQSFAKEYEYIIVDSPPNITLVAENVFNAADILIVPLIPTTLSLMAYDKLLQFFASKKLDNLKMYAFFSMVEKRKKMHREIMQKTFADGNRILNSHIPYSSEVEKMGIHREPVVRFQLRSVATLAYEQLWQEIKNIW